jgi:coenzyme F420-reducing hydrogenase delta subunit
VEYAQKLLEQIGLQGRRVQMINLSSAMGGQFAFSIAELTAEIKQLGPNPLNNGKDPTGLKPLKNEAR